MPFHWIEFLNLADDLATRSDEASLRSALSRAYYYVFHLASKRVKGNGFVYKRDDGGSHVQVWRIFSSSDDLECVKLAQIAERLKENRRRADYDNLFPRIDDYIPIALEEARDFAARLLKIDPSLPKPTGV
jgi:uncharacterized protein (UPF0332 family)